MEPLLPPHVHRVVHYRDCQRQVQPGIAPLTATAVASVAKDYDLARAQVRAVRVERAGQELSGYVALAAPRRYATPDDHGDAVVQLFLDDVRDVRFDSGAGAGATLAADTPESRSVSAPRVTFAPPRPPSGSTTRRGTCRTPAKPRTRTPHTAPPPGASLDRSSGHWRGAGR
jgi:hypothetical protein